MRKSLAAALLLPLLLPAGCSLPPYDEELSLAMITASKMALAAQIGPIQLWAGEYLGLSLIHI